MTVTTTFNVQNRIATFEAHNEGIRKTPSSAPSSPSRNISSLTTESSAPSTTYSPERPPSHTSLASHNRKQRLAAMALANRDIRVGGGSPTLIAERTLKSSKKSVGRSHESTKRQSRGSSLPPEALRSASAVSAVRRWQGEPKSATKRSEASTPTREVVEEIKTPTNKLSMSGMSRMAKIQRIHKNQRSSHHHQQHQQQQKQQTNQKHRHGGFRESQPEEIIRHTQSSQSARNNRKASPRSQVRHPDPLRKRGSGGVNGTPLFTDGPSTMHRRLVVQPSSSSDYETDASNSRSRHPRHKEQRLDYAQKYGVSNSATIDYDDHTIDYGSTTAGRDDASQTSINNQRRIRKEDLAAGRQKREEDARLKAVSAARAEMNGISHIGNTKSNESITPVAAEKPTMNPMTQTAIGIVAAGTVGCLLIGLPGVLVGAAAVGIGIGAMQIPAEQRSNIGSKAGVALKSAKESCLQASDHLSNTCANTYQESGIDEHVPDTVKTCCQSMPGDTNEVDTMAVGDDTLDKTAEATVSTNGDGLNTTMTSNDKVDNRATEKKNGSPNRNLNKNTQKVACLRQGQIMPGSKIYSLPPAQQPSAWLDVIASAETTYEEKLEAMEEIVILAKDKQTSQVFLNEGILDAILWILCRYFEKSKVDVIPSHWAHPSISAEEKNAAILAAACCLTLGKAHCAARHTEGNLMLMSRYDRGTVPEERQLAQMLHEVPHHTRVTVTNDPTTILPGSEIFSLQQLSLPKAEELAKSIKELADQR